MLSKFRSIAKEAIGETETGVYNFEEKLGDIERKLNSGSIDLAEAMKQTRSIFSYKLSDDAYRKIEKEVGYNI